MTMSMLQIKNSINKTITDMLFPIKLQECEKI